MGSPVTGPPPYGEEWAAAVEQVAPLVAEAGAVELPRRVPRQDLVPDAASPAESPRRLDPSTISAAMSAYARGVAGHRTPSS
jgi:hypothetical protein